MKIIEDTNVPQFQYDNSSATLNYRLTTITLFGLALLLSSLGIAAASMASLGAAITWMVAGGFIVYGHMEHAKQMYRRSISKLSKETLQAFTQNPKTDMRSKTLIISHLSSLD